MCILRIRQYVMWSMICIKTLSHFGIECGETNQFHLHKAKFKSALLAVCVEIHAQVNVHSPNMIKFQLFVILATKLLISATEGGT